MANEKMEKPDFSKIWGANGNVTYQFSDDNYLKGWGFIGNIPPARGMFDAYFQGTDKKLKWLDNELGDYINSDYTIDDTSTPTKNTDNLPNLLSGMAHMIKSANGTDDWKKEPQTSLDDLAGQIASNNLYHAEATGYGIVSGCEPSINGLTVTVGAGVIHTYDGRRVEVSKQSITLDAADATKPRTDVVYLDKYGKIAKLTGELGTPAVAGSNTYTISTNFVAGDTVSFGRVTFTCTASTQDTTNFALGSDAATSAANLATALNANTTINAIYTASTADSVITVTEITAGNSNTPGDMVSIGTGVISAGTAVQSSAAEIKVPDAEIYSMTVCSVRVSAGATEGTIESYKKYTRAHYVYDTVNQMIADASLQAGDIIHTLGYYAANDRGGATYILRAKSDVDVVSATADGATSSDLLILLKMV